MPCGGHSAKQPEELAFVDRMIGYHKAWMQHFMDRRVRILQSAGHEDFPEAIPCPAEYLPSSQKTRVSIIASDSRKDELKEWAGQNLECLFHMAIFATNRTADILASVAADHESELEIVRVGHAARGDNEVTHMIQHKSLAAVFFFVDVDDKDHQPEKDALINATVRSDVPIEMTMQGATRTLKLLSNHR